MMMNSGPIILTANSHGRYFRFRFLGTPLPTSFPDNEHVETIYAMDEHAARVAAWFALAEHFNVIVAFAKNHWRITSVQITHDLESLI